MSSTGGRCDNHLTDPVNVLWRFWPHIDLSPQSRTSTTFSHPKSVCIDVARRRFVAFCHQVSAQLLAFHRAEDSAFSEGERRVFARMCLVYARDLLPFLDRCLQILFPAPQMALVLGQKPSLSCSFFFFSSSEAYRHARSPMPMASRDTTSTFCTQDFPQNVIRKSIFCREGNPIYGTRGSSPARQRGPQKATRVP